MAAPGSIVWLVERNIHGAWVIYGANGIRQYYDYTQKQAIAKYKDEYKRTVFVNQ